VVPRAGLDGRKFSSPQGFDPGPSSPWSVAILAELPGPHMYVRMYVCMYVCMYVFMYVCTYNCTMTWQHSILCQFYFSAFCLFLHLTTFPELHFLFCAEL